jgi:hypothetical protein
MFPREHKLPGCIAPLIDASAHSRTIDVLEISVCPPSTAMPEDESHQEFDEIIMTAEANASHLASGSDTPSNSVGKLVSAHHFTFSLPPVG